ncbi:hypothetical protein DJ69_12630 [Halorubrum persicum]|uniref:Uncharacterized protein n=1 Tax=Halorubrum persicum TaxID=1383844 RepID=A0A2G1WGU4_9EURY|nr:hypothetical protein DJ69_12630 [Halorubrum persicum]
MSRRRTMLQASPMDQVVMVEQMVAMVERMVVMVAAVASHPSPRLPHLLMIIIRVRMRSEISA